MKKNQKKLLITVGIIAAAGLLVYAWRKKQLPASNTAGVKSSTLVGTNLETGTAIVSTVASPVNSSAKFMSAASGHDTWVVGGYNESAGGTWVFPEGNIAGGRFIAGRLTAAQGTKFTPAFFS